MFIHAKGQKHKEYEDERMAKIKLNIYVHLINANIPESKELQCEGTQYSMIGLKTDLSIIHTSLSN